jgi:glycosyltransferase involved in cell wall biosynthesis
VNYGHAKAKLKSFSPKPAGDCSSDCKVGVPVYDLEVVIPVYNSEKYISECLDSVLNQKTDYSFHVILVDDGSSDSTSSIVEQYISDKLSVIRQENGGTSKARNTGINNSRGRYLMFVDSDDVLPQNTIQVLMKKAFLHSSDIVEGSADYTLNNRRFRYYSHEDCSDTDFRQVNACIWGKVFSRSLFETFRFPEGYWYEDTVDGFFFYRMAEKVATVPDVVYIYRNNAEGMTSLTKNKPKALDTYWITEICLEEYFSRGFCTDERFISILRNQFIVNCKRMNEFEEEIQKAVFACSCELLEKYKVPFEGAYLFKLMEKRDYGKYRLYCLTH